MARHLRAGIDDARGDATWSLWRTRGAIYRGEEALGVDGVLYLPCERYLQTLRPGEPLP